MNLIDFKKNKIAIIGLGYVGLPLAVEFSRKFDVVGYDINKIKIDNLKKQKNISEISKKDFRQIKSIKITSEKKFLKNCNIFIITVPTPVHKNNKPNLDLLIKATRTVAKVLKNNDLIIFESTVYPGTTEEICVPILEKNSKLVPADKISKNNKKVFYYGYSPERMNPTDGGHLLKNTNKIISGCKKNVTRFLKKLYGSIIDASIIETPSIKVAEASKMIENVQRDLNIALVNELSIIFNKMGINTLDVLNAADTKWNFSIFYPGLVGGHCIGIDPYYLAHKARLLKVKSELILGGRKINDNMSKYVAKNFLNSLKKNNNIPLSKKRALIMGVTFKENCPDVRNSKVMDLYKHLKSKGLMVDLYDPVANKEEFLRLYRSKLIRDLKKKSFYDGILVAVRHNYFRKLGLKKIRECGKKNATLFDLKSVFPKEKTDFRL